MDSATEQAWIRYLQEHGLATWEEIEAGLRDKNSGPDGTLDSVLVRQNIITPAQRETIQKKIQEQRTGLTQLGSFRLSRKLGEGGMGAVYLAEDSLAGRTVAIKVLPSKFSSNPEFVARFRREARSTGKLSHPNIVAAYSFGEDGGHHYFVMEYMAGAPLDSRLKNGGRVPWDEAVAIIKQVAAGLEYAHNHGLIHRDIKPGNIFIAETGEAKILDLGLSKSIDENEQSFMTQSGAVLGTPHYISPEQARSDKGIDGRTDIYSLGATFYHLVTGKTPFEGSGAAVILMKHLTEQLPNPLDLNPDLPEAVVQVICKMMAKHPLDRYANCEELIADLELISEGKTPSAAHLEGDKSSVMMRRLVVNTPTQSMIQPAQPEVPHTKTVRLKEDKRPSRRLVWQFAGAALAAILVGVFLVGMRGNRSRDENRVDASAKGKEVAVVAPEPKQIPKESPKLPETVTAPPKVAVAPVTPAPTRPEPAQSSVQKKVDLLALVDLERDVVRGRWTRRDDGIASDATGDFGVGVGGARVQFPYRMPAEYDLRVEFTKQSGPACVAVLFPSPRGSIGLAGTYAYIVGGWGNSTAGFELVNGMNAQPRGTPEGQRNETVRVGQWLRTGERQTIVLQVRRQSARVSLDGTEIGFSPPSYRNMSPAHWYSLRDQTLAGVSSWSSPTVFHTIELTEITGSGEPTRGTQ